MDSPPRHSRSTSQHSQERRPLGPRTPSPLPPSNSSVQLPIQFPTDHSPVDDDLVHEPIPSPSRPSTVPSRHQGTPTAIPRSKRQPFFPPNNSESTPKTAGVLPLTTPNIIEPLSIKKKSSVRVTNGGSPMPARKTYARNSPLSRHSARITPSRRVSPQLGKRKLPATSHSSAHDNESTERMLEMCRATTDDVSNMISWSCVT
jgi:protein ECT2